MVGGDGAAKRKATRASSGRELLGELTAELFDVRSRLLELEGRLNALERAGDTAAAELRSRLDAVEHRVTALERTRHKTTRAEKA